MEPTEPAVPEPAEVDQARTDPPARHGRLGLVLGLAGTLFVLDLLTKLLVVARLEGQKPIELLGGFLTFKVIRNSGAAFGIGAGFTVVFTLIAAGVVVFIVRQARRLTSIWWAIALGALLGGALGNLVDRIFRSPGFFEGHVVDFVSLPNFAIFNIADMAITCAGVGIALLALFNVPLGEDTSDDEDEEGAAASAESAGTESEASESEAATTVDPAQAGQQGEDERHG